LHCASLATMCMALGVFLYEGITYNVVFLGKVLPLVGKGSWTYLFFLLFNTVWGLALACYLRAHLADPGAVPKRWQEFVSNVGDALPIAPARPEWQPGKATFCKKCERTRPERAKHCKVCEKCILRMDHHCPWINNCVGFKNHKFFLLLGIYSLLASLTALATSLPELVRCIGAVMRVENTGYGWEAELMETPDAFAFLIFGLLALFICVLLTPLLATHIPLATQNLTTIEDNYENMPNPFDQGNASGNIAQIFGIYGWDWYFPVEPKRPLSDGVSFARSDERLTAQRLTNLATGSGLDYETEAEDLEPEELWRMRFQVRTPSVMISEVVDGGPLSALARWWHGEVP